MHRLNQLITIGVLGGMLLAFAVVAASAEECQVNPNTATAEELEYLPGVGPAKAEAVVRAREEGWKLERPGDISQVHGFGEKTAAKLEKYLTADGETTCTGPASGKSSGKKKYGAPPKEEDNEGERK